MEEFRSYLDAEGASFSKSEEVLAFFALPYIPNPSEHQAFKHIFTVKWLSSLKDKIRKAVGKGELNASMLKNLFEGNEISSAGDDRKVRELQEKLNAVNEENKRLQQKVVGVKDKYTEYIEGFTGVARDMFRVIELAKFELVSEDTVSETFKALSSYDSNLKMFSPVLQSPNELNFQAVVHDLGTLPNENQLCALLQAIRWRLTRTPRTVRKHNLYNYLEFNLLGTKAPQRPILDFLLGGTRKVKEYSIRLLNVLTSESIAREYLLEKENLISLLLGVLYSEKQDTGLRQNSLGVLQKLSLKKTAQINMIRLDVLDWLLKILKSTGEISNYTLEYSTALLMNLSLRTFGKEKLCKNANDVMNVMNKYISSENNQVRTYVNGTLYSILTRKPMKEAAIKIGLEKKLKNVKNKADENIKRQINFILEQLKQEENNCPTDEAEEEPDEQDSDSEEDSDISEFEDMEDVLNIQGQLTGEDLLREKYLIKKFQNLSIKKDEEKKATEKFQKKIEPGRGNKVAPMKESQDYSKVFISNDKIPRTPA